MNEFDLHGWFDKEELESCPTCEQHTALKLNVSGSLFCLECGELGPPAEASPPSNPVQ